MNMHIHSISRLFALPLILSAAYIGYVSYGSHYSHSYLIFIPVTLLVALYVFHGPIDHWWLSKYPIPLDAPLKKWLELYFAPYKTFTSDLKNRFEQRLMLYLEGRLFESVGKERQEVPEDVKAMVAAHGVHMSLSFADYLLGDMDRIYLYKHPFPSPAHPFLHTVETHSEDGVIILSLEQATNAVLFPSDYYNIVYHAYAEAIIATQKKIQWPQSPEDSWNLITQISGWEKEVFQSQTGFENLPLLPVWITIFFTHKENVSKKAPGLHQSFSDIFSPHA